MRAQEHSTQQIGRQAWPKKDDAIVQEYDAIVLGLGLGLGSGLGLGLGPGLGSGPGQGQG
jgi:hypothetical protein